jgi:hypothetical protein
VYVRKPAFGCLSLTLALACGPETTSPTTDPPVAAVTRTVTTFTFQTAGQNPCTQEGLVLTIVATITTQVTNGSAKYAYILRITGLGELGTTYAGQVQQTDVVHPAGETAHLTEVLRGSDGSRFSVLAVVALTNGVPRVEFTEFRCR